MQITRLNSAELAIDSAELGLVYGLQFRLLANRNRNCKAKKLNLQVIFELGRHAIELTVTRSLAAVQARVNVTQQMADAQLLLSVRMPLPKLVVLLVGADLEDVFDISVAPLNRNAASLDSVVAGLLGLS